MSAPPAQFAMAAHCAHLGGSTSPSTENPEFDVQIHSPSPAGSGLDGHPRTPLRLTWRDVFFTLKVQRGRGRKRRVETREILRGVSGSAEPGEMLAIMGSSGAGKTTLLNVLSGRVHSSRRVQLGGQIALNGQPIAESNFVHLSAYVMQDDILMETLSVREVLLFAARLRLPTSEAVKQQRVEQLIDELNLRKCADTRLGGALERGVSGGERKRCAIGVELVTDPGLVFLDEPTSGLDSLMAYTVIETLKTLAREGRTVLTTIHQPSSEMFQMFDKLCLLAAGRTVYLGPAARAVDHFAELGCRCPPYSNPADYFMKILSTGTPEDDKRVDMLISGWDRMEAAAATAPAPAALPSVPKLKRVRGVSRWREFWLLTDRAWKNNSRQPVLNKARFAQTVFIALLTGLLFLRIGYDQKGIYNRQGALFFSVVTMAFNSINGIVISFPAERALFLRERAGRLYSVSAYFFGKTLAEMPSQFFFPVLFAAIVYWLVGFNPGFQHFLVFCLVLIVAAITGQSLGLLLGAASPTTTIAVTLTPILIIPFMLMAGFFVSPSTIPPWFIWIHYISLFRYSFFALMYNEFDGETFYCKPSQLVGVAPNTVCPETTGEQVLTNLGINLSLWGNFFLLLALAAAFRLLALGVLALVSRRKLARG